MLKKVKNRYPTNIVRNNFIDNPKESTIETPLWLSEYIFKIVSKKLNKKIKYVLDVGCYKGNLSKPWKEAKYKCFGIDEKKIKYPYGPFFQFDFLNMLHTLPLTNKQELIICNPPFNDTQRKYGRKLIPELFLRQIFEMWGSGVPLIFFSPMGILKNQKLSSSRWKWIRDCGAKITSELELPIDSYIPKGNLKKCNNSLKKWKDGFGNRYPKDFDRELGLRNDELKKKYKIILVHSSVLFFNIPGLPAKIFLED